jgi:hypothetical protein
LIFVVVLLVAVIFGYYTRRGSGINQTPYRRESGPMETPSELAHDMTQHVSEWERGTAGHYGRHRPPAVHKPVDPVVEEALVRWREGSGTHGHLDPPVGPGDHTRGPDDATTVVAYVDLSSASCRNACLVLESVGGRQPMRLVVRHLPLADAHELALPAAETLEAAGAQGHFFEVYDQLVREGFDDEAELAEIAGERVPDPSRLRSEVGEGRYRARVVEHIHQATASGAHGVPELYINGVRYDGDLEPDALTRALAGPVAT